MSVLEPEVVGISLEQTAHILSIKEESVRKHVSRGTLQAEKDEDGRL